MADIPALYASGRACISELVQDLSPEAAATRVPTCPEWTVHDVVSHLTGICADILGGNIGGLASDEWTAAQVRARRDRSIGDVVAEWNEVAPQVEAFAQHFPGRAGDQWVTDQTTHEHDIRLALGQSGARESAAVLLGAGFLVGGLWASLTARGVGPIEVRTEVGAWVVGGGPGEADDAARATAVDDALQSVVLEAAPLSSGGDPVGTVKLSDFELMRALTGRRSVAQIAAYDWSVDPEPYLAAFQFGPFTTSPVDIPE